MDYKVEICANSVVSCLEAQNGGANRVELCAGIPEGGTTPSYGNIYMARKLIDIQLYVIIRPRGGDFLYSNIEHQIMMKDIEKAAELGVDGIVIGCLTANGEVDMKRNRELINVAGNMNVTFHRAFDMCVNPFEALEQIISLGCERILTSGQQPKAEQGIPLLKQLVTKADNRIIIMPGSGINTDNITTIAKATGANEFHLSARKSVKSNMRYRNPHVKMGGNTISINEYEHQITNSQLVKDTFYKLQNIER